MSNNFKFLFLLFIFPLSIFAQKNGMVVEKDSSGTIRAKGKMQDGKKEGRWKTFYDTGDLQTIVDYSDDKKNGIYLEYLYGDTIASGHYKNDIAVGEWKKWGGYFQLLSIENFDENGNKLGGCRYWDSQGSLTESSVYYSDGTAVRNFYEFGKIIAVRKEKDNMSYGKQINYNQYPQSPADSIAEIREYSLNKQNGIDLVYSNGKIIRESHYCNDLLCDTMKTFDDNGVAYDFVPFVNGKKEGVERIFSNGQLTQEISYHQDLRNGKRFVQTESGRLLLEDWFSNGILDSAKGYFTDASLGIESKIYKVSRDTADQLYVTQKFARNGNLLEESHVIRSTNGGSYLEGESKTFYTNGKQKYVITYNKGEINGRFQKWNENGILMLESNRIKNELKDSTFVWDDSGKPIQSGTVAFDQAVVKSMQVGMEFTSSIHGDGPILSPLHYYKFDSTASFEDCKVYSFAEYMPEFPGGETAFMTFLNKNIKYPQMEKEEGKTGTVYISFIVTKEGKVVNVKCVKEIKGAPGLNKEALRVFKTMPNNWTPGSIDGKNVNVVLVQPVKFVLQ